MWYARPNRRFFSGWHTNTQKREWFICIENSVMSIFFMTNFFRCFLHSSSPSYETYDHALSGYSYFTYFFISFVGHSKHSFIASFFLLKFYKHVYVVLYPWKWSPRKFTTWNEHQKISAVPNRFFSLLLWHANTHKIREVYLYWKLSDVKWLF